MKSTTSALVALTAANVTLTAADREKKGKAIPSGIGQGKAPRRKREFYKPIDNYTNWSSQPGSAFMDVAGLELPDFQQLLTESKPFLLKAHNVTPHHEVKGGHGLSRKLTLENQLLIPLDFMRNPTRIGAFGVKYGVKQIGNYLRHGVQALALAIIAKEIRWPTLSEQLDLLNMKLALPFEKVWGYFDGTYTPVTRSIANYDGHRDLFARTSQVCIDVTGAARSGSSGFAAGQHDSIVFAKTPLSANPPPNVNPHPFLPGSKVGGDKAYKSVQKHVQAPGSDDDSIECKMFVKHRSTVEHYFGSLKREWRCCQETWPLPRDMHLQALTFLVSVALLNRQLRLYPERFREDFATVTDDSPCQCDSCRA